METRIPTTALWAPLSEVEALKRRVAELEAENARLRAQLEGPPGAVRAWLLPPVQRPDFHVDEDE